MGKVSVAVVMGLGVIFLVCGCGGDSNVVPKSAVGSMTFCINWPEDGVGTWALPADAEAVAVFAWHNSRLAAWALAVRPETEAVLADIPVGECFFQACAYRTPYISYECLCALSEVVKCEVLAGENAPVILALEPAA